PDVTDDADHLESAAVNAAEPSELVDWIVSAPVARHRRLIEDDAQRILARVGFGEESAAMERNPHRLEVTRVGNDVGRPLTRLRVDRVAFAGDRHGEAAAGE